MTDRRICSVCRGLFSSGPHVKHGGRAVPDGEGENGAQV